MKLILVTTPNYFIEEDKILTALFEEGLDILHMCKPSSVPMFAERLLTLIPSQYHKRIVQLGLSNAEIAFYTSWFYLPWVIKPLWSPFIDILKTKRWWVLTMELLLGAAFAGVAFCIPTSFWLQASICMFWLLAFSSATHDIAADGFYMLGLDEHDQALYVGIRNTFYRIASIFGKGVLVMLAGSLQLLFRGQIKYSWSIIFYGMAGVFIGLYLWHNYTMPSPQADAEIAHRHHS